MKPRPTIRWTILLLLTPCWGFSQKIEKFYDFLWHETEPKYARFFSQVEKTDSGWRSRDFFLNNGNLQMEGYYEDSACKIASGRFIYLYPDKKIQMYGRNLHNKKEGLWISYYPDGMMSDSTMYDNGNPTGTKMGWHRNGYSSDSCVYKTDGSGVEVKWFDNGNPWSAGILSAGYQRHGTWKFFHKNGKTSALELYDHGLLVDKQYFDEAGVPMSDTTNKDRAASFPGGSKAWLNYLDRHLYWPDQYKITNSDKAAVVITLTVNEDGKVQDVYVSTPFFPQFDRIALDVIRRSPNWIPAMNHNRRVMSVFRQPVVFSQPE